MFEFLTGNKGAEMVGKAVDGIRDGLDALVFTDEEKTRATKTTFDQIIEFNRIMVDQGSVQAVTRRLLAVSIVAYYILLTTLAVILHLVGCINDAEYIFRVIDLYSWAFTSVIVIYFGPHQLQKITKRN